MHSGNKRQSKSGAGKGQRGVGGAGAPPSTGYHLIGLPLSVSAGGRSAAISQKREGSVMGLTPDAQVNRIDKMRTCSNH